MKEYIKTKAAFLCRWQPRTCTMIDRQFDEKENGEQTIIIDCEECSMNPNNALRF